MWGRYLYSSPFPESVANVRLTARPTHRLHATRYREKGEEAVYMRREDHKLLQKLLEKEKNAQMGKE